MKKKIKKMTDDKTLLSVTILVFVYSSPDFILIEPSENLT